MQQQLVQQQIVEHESSVTLNKSCKTENQIVQHYPLDETHLDAVGGLIELRSFTLVHQQVEFVGAMRLRPIRTNRSVSC